MKPAVSKRSFALAALLAATIVVTGCGNSKKGNGGYSVGPLVHQQGPTSATIRVS